MYLVNLIKKAGEGVGEYFLGTETHKFYKNGRLFLGEYLLDEDELKKELRHSKINEAMDICLGKIVPDLIDSLAVGSYLYTENYYLLAFSGAGEALRLLGYWAISQNKKYWKNIHNSIKLKSQSWLENQEKKLESLEQELGKHDAREGFEEEQDIEEEEE